MRVGDLNNAIVRGYLVSHDERLEDAKSESHSFWEWGICPAVKKY